MAGKLLDCRRSIVFFFRVDRDRSGTITANELQQALSNGNNDLSYLMK